MFVNVDAVERFVKELIRAVKAERRAEIAAMHREMRTLSGQERERRGRAILGLRGKKIGQLLDQTVVRFGRAREIRTEIRPGDVVLISRSDPLRSNVTGTVLRVGKRFIDVAVRDYYRWFSRDVRLDLYADDLTFRRWLDILKKLPDRARRALEFALGLRTPSAPVTVQIQVKNDRLDESKRRAVTLALGSRDFFLIHGPFGTGKTTTLVELIEQLVDRGETVLATAETNVAVDNIVERLWGHVRIVRVGNPARVSRVLLETTLTAMVEKHPMYKEIVKLQEEREKLREELERFITPIPKYRRGMDDETILRLAEEGRASRGVDKTTIWGMAEWIKRKRKIDELTKRIREIEERIVHEIIRDADVVLTTNSSAALELIPTNFDVAVIDEAAQATIPSVLIPISKAKRFILAGDHKQLPPTILSNRAKILERTLFEILIERYPENSSMLDVQYRMNERLAEFPSREFYDGHVKTAESVKNITLRDLGIDDDTVLEFIDTKALKLKEERRKRGETSIYNPVEAEIIARTVEGFLKMGVDPRWIGVITPYDAQKDLLRRLLPEDIEVNTVDGYQGREKEIIVISFVRSNRAGRLGFLEDLRRLNVALTRAKRRLTMVGDSGTLSRHPTYRRLVDYVKKHGKYVLLRPAGESAQNGIHANHREANL